MTKITFHAGDNRISLRRLIDQGIRVHSVVTDAPYGLVSIQKRFGKEGAAAARTERNDGSFARLSGGFMGKQWDGSGIERDPEFWRLVYDILLPGGYCFAFSGSRTGHWQACAMEMAGFIMHPMHGWANGQGFPKAHNASKAIDKLLGTTDQRQMVEVKYEAKRFAPGATVVKEGGYRKRDEADGNEQTFVAGTEIGGSPEAREWDGWAYGTQAQKPLLEPIFLGQKPFDAKNGAANLLKHGVGAVNIDGCRVPSEGGQPRQGEASQDRRYTENGSTNFAALPVPRGGDPLGRHPGNLLLDGSDEVLAMFPDSKGQQGALRGTEAGAVGENANCYGEYGARPPTSVRGDSGSAARFFHQFPLEADAVIYHPKAGKLDRAGSRHPTVKPIALLQYLIRHITPPGGIVLDPFAGSGTTAEAARREGYDCILMEAEDEYVQFLHERFPETKTDTTDSTSLTHLLI